MQFPNPQVRLSWLLPLRLLTIAPLALYYYGQGFSHPILQAAVCMGTSVTSSLLKDASERGRFLKARRLRK